MLAEQDSIAWAPLMFMGSLRLRFLADSPGPDCPSVSISAAPFAESTMLARARAYEQATEWHTKRPALKSV
jgi:hypothetical protein